MSIGINISNILHNRYDDYQYFNGYNLMLCGR